MGLKFIKKEFFHLKFWKNFVQFTLLSANCSVCIFPYYLLKHFTGNSFRHEIESNPWEKIASFYASLKILKYIFYIKVYLKRADQVTDCLSVVLSVVYFCRETRKVLCMIWCALYTIYYIVCWLWGRGSICLVS